MKTIRENQKIQEELNNEFFQTERRPVEKKENKLEHQDLTSCESKDSSTFSLINLVNRKVVKFIDSSTQISRTSIISDDEKIDKDLHAYIYIQTLDNKFYLMNKDENGLTWKAEIVEDKIELKQFSEIDSGCKLQNADLIKFGNSFFLFLIND